MPRPPGTAQSPAEAGPPSLGRKALVLGSWLAAANVLQLFLGFWREHLLGPWLGPERMGGLGFALALAGTADMVVQAGLGPVLTRDVAADPRKDGSHLGTALAMRSAYMALALPVLVWLGGPFAALYLVGLTGQLGVAVLRAKMLKVPQVAATLVPPVFSLGLVAACWKWAEPSAPVALAALAGAFCLATAFQLPLAFSRLKSRLAWSGGLAARVFRGAWPLWLAGVAVAFLYRIDVFLLKALLSGAEADRAIGLYRPAYTLVESGHFVLGSLVAVAFPAMSALTRGPTARLRAAYGRAVTWSVGLGLLAMIAALVLGGPAIILIYREGFAPAVPALQVLSPALVFVLLNGLTTSLLTALHRTRTVLAVVLGQFAAKASLSLVLIPRFGFTGAAGASVAAEAAGTLVLLVVASRVLAAREAGERGSRG